MRPRGNQQKIRWEERDYAELGHSGQASGILNLTRMPPQGKSSGLIFTDSWEENVVAWCFVIVLPLISVFFPSSTEIEKLCDGVRLARNFALDTLEKFSDQV